MWQRRPAADWSLDIFAVLKINPEGIAIIQPRVARHELPWEVAIQSVSTLKELNQRTGLPGITPHHNHWR
jgi:hypothetical protein